MLGISDTMSISDYDPILQLDNALPDKPVSSLEAMQAVVTADGDIELAAVRLSTKKANILTAIVTDPANHDTLSRYFRAHQLLKLNALIGDVTTYLEPKLEELSARDLARTLTSLLDTFGKFTEPSAAPMTNVNPVEATLKMFPPHVVAAIRELAIARDTDVDASD